MLYAIFSRFPFLEVCARRLLFLFPGIKKKLKKKFRRNHSGDCFKFDINAWNAYKNQIDSISEEECIFLVFSSMDGLHRMGVDEKEVLSFLNTLVEKGCTIVLPAYPVTNLKMDSGRVYDPQKTPCWTGLLPNLFILSEGVRRSSYPFNTLAAYGPKAEEMMRDDSKQIFVYGEHSAWKYCVDNHAKILFIGTTCNESNTIQTHMIPDVMKDKWPISNWYNEHVCKVRVGGEIVERRIMVQNIKWTKYVADSYMTRLLKKKEILHETEFNGCPLGWIDDAKVMVDFLVENCNKGKLMYLVPHKYYK